MLVLFEVSRSEDLLELVREISWDDCFVFILTEGDEVVGEREDSQQLVGTLYSVELCSIFLGLNDLCDQILDASLVSCLLGAKQSATEVKLSI